MKIRKRYIVLLLTPVAVLCILAVTNPSQTQHAARFVAKLSKLEDEHFATCPKCRGSQPGSRLDVYDIISMQGEDGTYYRSLFFLSYFSRGGLIHAKTIGIGGVVFGPAITQPMRCPKDYVLPQPTLDDHIEHTFDITIRSDGTILVDAKPITQAALLKRLDELPDKGETEVTLHVGPDTQHTAVVDLIDQIGSLGFQIVLKTIPEGDPPEK